MPSQQPTQSNTLKNHRLVIHLILARYRILYEPVDWTITRQFWELITEEEQNEAYETVEQRMSRRGRSMAYLGVVFGLLFTSAMALLIGLPQTRRPVALGLICAMVFIIPRFGQLFPRRRANEGLEAMGYRPSQPSSHTRASRKERRWQRYKELVSRNHKQRSDVKSLSWGFTTLLVGVIAALLPFAF